MTIGVLDSQRPSGAFCPILPMAAVDKYLKLVGFVEMRRRY